MSCRDPRKFALYASCLGFTRMSGRTAPHCGTLKESATPKPLAYITPEVFLCKSNHRVLFPTGRQLDFSLQPHAGKHSIGGNRAPGGGPGYADLYPHKPNQLLQVRFNAFLCAAGSRFFSMPLSGGLSNYYVHVPSKSTKYISWASVQTQEPLIITPAHQATSTN